MKTDLGEKEAQLANKVNGQTELLRILTGDALAQLVTLPDESVQCCVTSPPYWGLRDYGFCSCRKHRIQHESSTLAGSQAGTPNHVGEPQADCPICRGSGRIAGTEDQIGLESSPSDYVKRLVALFSEVRRVLRADGTLWLNLGDSYSGNGKGGGTGVFSSKQLTNHGSLGLSEYGGNVPDGLKPKDLVGIPWRVAFALQADGWYLRSDIIWHKPNPMPESVEDRPTKAHEYLFLLSKSQRYFYNAEAIQEPAMPQYESRYKYAFGGKKEDALRESGIRTGCTGKREPPRKHDGTTHGGNGDGFKNHRGYNSLENPFVRNKRTVWTIPTQSYADAHTYPPALITPCILAGSRPGDTILDPFAGSGTTGMVALELGRKAILIELNPEYIKLIKGRCDITPGFEFKESAICPAQVEEQTSPLLNII